MASLQKNVSGQNFTFCLVLASSGAAAVGVTVTGFVTKDNGAQAGTAGTFTGSGNGQYNYAPTQAETNATDVGFLLTGTGVIPVNVDFHTDLTDSGGNVLVDVTKINSVSASSVTAVNAIIGTTNAITVDSNGNVSTTSNIKKNTATSGFMFVMINATTGAPMTGLTITSQRSIDGAAFASCANSASEIGLGWYTINLAASDVNGNHIGLRFSSAGANDTDVELVTQP